METTKKLIERLSKPKPANKPTSFTRLRFPIGTWKMPCYGPSAAYSLVKPGRGEMVAGTGRPKGQ